MIYGYLFSVLAAFFIGGLTYGLVLLGGVPLWLLIAAWGSALPLYAVSLIAYVGGFIHGWKKIFRVETTGNAGGDAGSAKP